MKKNNIFLKREIFIYLFKIIAIFLVVVLYTMCVGVEGKIKISV